MPKDLVVVESPAKAKTISHYLGAGYRVIASVGHVRDLPAKRLAVAVEEGFRPEYAISLGKKAVLASIRKAANESEHVYLATDPDREGEAIAWHVAQAAGIKLNRCLRVSFDQVTESAVKQAIDNPREIDMQLVDAQQARRVLDRLVGYKISPLLGKSVRRGASAGRVQSVALRLVVDREREIDGFCPGEYWSLEARFQRLTARQEAFVASLFKVADKAPDLCSKKAVEQVQEALAGVQHRVESVKHGTRRKRPPAPFITSTLQASASSVLHMSPRQTMRIAQQLYEGIDIDGQRAGLVTYMRTDSPHVAPEAQQEVRQLIEERWGAGLLPSRPPVYTTKAKSAQEAHEAIRPTSATRTPELLANHLDRQQFRLYELIWKRFVASQMLPALYETTTVDIKSGENYVFRANAQKLASPGYLEVYQTTEEQHEQDKSLPRLEAGESLDLLELLPEQHFTQPPPRYSEAMLIKELESRGIGRPSTFASIVTVIQHRKYVSKEKGHLVPTQLGFAVCDVLLRLFPQIMDYGYTASMEAQLDGVAAGDQSYAQMLGEFWEPFFTALSAAGKDLADGLAVLSEEVRERIPPACPRCGKPLKQGVSAQGPFARCTGFPECKYLLDLSDPKESREVKEEFVPGEQCELCGGRMKVIRKSKQQFLGCENYPKCKNTRPIGGYSQEILTLARDQACPDCGQKRLQPKSGRYGEYLYCPACKKNISLKRLLAGTATVKQVDMACPRCDHRPLEHLQGKYGAYYHCPECGKNTSEKAMSEEKVDPS